MVNCLFALARLPPNYLLHLNGLSEVAGFKELLFDLGIPFLDHGWISSERMPKLLDQMDLGLQISFSESFGYLVTEHLLRGIPVLGSSMVPPLDWLKKELREPMQVIRADDPEAIADQIQGLLSDRERSRYLARQARRQILSANRKLIGSAREVLQQLI
ncbi:glycosyltransferase [bacterium]|nr:glycosyltransferase [bacterium]